MKTLSIILVLVTATMCDAAESLWLEAEHFTGIRGHCWPMGPAEMKRTDGHWALSGPGWAAEWSQGGESGFLSIATGAGDDRAVVTRKVEIPVDGQYSIWVRYGDWREKTERFQVEIEQAERPRWTGHYGERTLLEEDNVMKLYWGWGFVWSRQSTRLQKGTATISLLSTTKEPEPRQIDVIVLTTDEQYHPWIKEQPFRESWSILEAYRDGVPEELEPLARRRPDFELPESWRTKTFRDRDFLYLWNVNTKSAVDTWMSDKADRVRYPYNIGDQEAREEFEALYGGRDDVPIFSDPRIVPTFHGAGAGVFETDPDTGEVKQPGKRFATWLDNHPDRAWAMMMNYHPGNPIGEQGVALFEKYRDRYVGSISGESLGYFYPPADEMRASTETARTRRELVEALAPVTLKYNAEKYRKVYGRDIDSNPYQDVIACFSVGNIAFAPLCFDWGARIVGYESATATSSVLNMRWAFMRGAARQHGGLTGTYRSCNFGDSSTIFANTSSFHSPQNILDNYYSVFSGAGMTWYKFDIWYQYMAGSSLFYHEQGHDEYWRPGGTAVAGIREVQLSPKGKLVDRFLRVTADNPDRGSPFTPVAFLVDSAHGWEPAPFWPNSFKNWHKHQDRFLFGDHERMLEEWFWTAYYPIGPESEKPITGTNEVFLPGVFGDIFDVIFAYPDVSKWRTIDTYPVIIAVGEIELTAAEGRRLSQYVENGGTLLVADSHLTGPGADALNLPPTEGSRQADEYRWHLSTDERAPNSGTLESAPQDLRHPSPRFRYRPISPAAGKTIASTPDGDVFCAAVDYGKGRLVFLSVPHGLSITRRAHPAVARLMAHLTRGLMPIEVDGDVQWMVNRTHTGWTVTLLNPAGQSKPQQGITPTDFRENRQVVIRSRLPLTRADDLLLLDEPLTVNENQVQCEVTAGGVRLIRLR